MNEPLTVCGKSYRILRLLGHGKGGYSYLARAENAEAKQVVLKQIHHEPCDYYHFGNKIEAERRDYQLLRGAHIRVPALLAVDAEAERIVKEYGERSESPEKRLKEKDKRRAAYHRFYTDMKWGHAQNYHVCLDSGEFGIEKCAEIIAQLY